MDTEDLFREQEYDSEPEEEEKIQYLEEYDITNLFLAMKDYCEENALGFTCSSWELYRFLKRYYLLDQTEIN